MSSQGSLDEGAGDQSRRKQCDNRSKDRRGVSTSQGMLAVNRSFEEAKNRFPMKSPEEIGPAADMLILVSFQTSELPNYKRMNLF